MVDFDPANQAHPDAPLVVSGGKPSVAELKAAIAASQFSASYDTAFMMSATKNDLLYICRVHGIDVPGLPGDGAFPVNAPAISVQPANDSVADPATGEFTVVATGSTPLYYQWYVSTGAAFVLIAGADEATYTTPATVPGDDGNEYQVKVWNSAGSVYSDPATLTVT